MDSNPIESTFAAYRRSSLTQSTAGDATTNQEV
jgi:hypothetical protein